MITSLHIKSFLLSLSLTIAYLYVTTNNNIILKYK
jgi:hypothetical protein